MCVLVSLLLITKFTLICTVTCLFGEMHFTTPYHMCVVSNREFMIMIALQKFKRKGDQCAVTWTTTSITTISHLWGACNEQYKIIIKHQMVCFESLNVQCAFVYDINLENSKTSEKSIWKSQIDIYFRLLFSVWLRSQSLFYHLSYIHTLFLSATDDKISFIRLYHPHCRVNFASFLNLFLSLGDEYYLQFIRSSNTKNRKNGEYYLFRCKSQRIFIWFDALLCFEVTMFRRFWEIIAPENVSWT